MTRRTHFNLKALASFAIDNPTRLVDRLLAIPSHEQIKLKDDPRRSMLYRATIDGQTWVVKTYYTSRFKGLFQRITRTSPPWREWRSAMQLHAMGRRVSLPIALILGTRSSLILPYVEGEPLNQFAVTCTDVARRLKLSAAIGRQTKALLTRGTINRDHKLSNLIADVRCLEQGDEPVMIDPLGIGRYRNEPQVIRMWATLLRTTLREGPISIREGLTCLKAAQATHHARAILAEAHRQTQS